MDMANDSVVEESSLGMSTSSGTTATIGSAKVDHRASNVTLLSTDGSLTTLSGLREELTRASCVTMPLGTWGDFHHEHDQTEETSTVYDIEFSLKETSKSECPEHPPESRLNICNLNSPNTRALLQHYLDASESVENFKLSHLKPALRMHQLGKYLLDFCQFLFVVLSSRLFWTACLMIINVLAAVFFYLVIAVSAIFITIIVTLHDALIQPSDEQEVDEIEEVKKRVLEELNSNTTECISNE